MSADRALARSTIGAALIGLALSCHDARMEDGCRVTLERAGPAKIAIIKAVRAATGLGLRDAKALAEAAPSEIRSGVSAELAADIERELEQAGGTASVACDADD